MGHSNTDPNCNPNTNCSPDSDPNPNTNPNCKFPAGSVPLQCQDTCSTAQPAEVVAHDSIHYSQLHLYLTEKSVVQCSIKAIEHLPLCLEWLTEWCGNV